MELKLEELIEGLEREARMARHAEAVCRKNEQDNEDNPRWDAESERQRRQDWNHRAEIQEKSADVLRYLKKYASAAVNPDNPCGGRHWSGRISSRRPWEPPEEPGRERIDSPEEMMVDGFVWRAGKGRDRNETSEPSGTCRERTPLVHRMEEELGRNGLCTRTLHEAGFRVTGQEFRILLREEALK